MRAVGFALARAFPMRRSPAVCSVRNPAISVLGRRRFAAVDANVGVATTLSRLEDAAEDLELRGRLDEALRKRRVALQIKADALGQRHALTALGHGKLSQLLLRRGHLDSAMFHAQTAVGIYREVFDPTHRALAASLRDLALVLIAKKRWLDAEEMLAEAVGVASTSSATSANDITTAEYEQQLAEVLLRLGKPAAALQLVKRARQVFEARLGPDHLWVLTTRADTAACLNATERHGAAAEECHDVAEITGRAQGAALRHLHYRVLREWRDALVAMEGPAKAAEAMGLAVDAAAIQGQLAKVQAQVDAAATFVRSREKPA